MVEDLAPDKQQRSAHAAVVQSLTVGVTMICTIACINLSSSLVMNMKMSPYFTLDVTNLYRQ